ncbi:MAG: hypothetical protein GXY06_01025 [Clostridiaceae bacterium]|nr:hypothetical protein [Clostridiaceae bacterium]
MKTTWTRVISGILLMSLIFSASACQREHSSDEDDNDQVVEPIDFDDFVDIMDDLGYGMYKNYAGENVDEAYYAYSEDYKYVVMVEYYDEKSDAKDEINDMIKELDEAKRDEDFEGSIKKSGKGNYKKIVVNGEFEDYVDNFYGEMYVVIIRSDEMILMVFAQDTGKSYIKEVDKVVEELGY